MKKWEAAELAAALTAAIEYTQTIVDSETPLGRERSTDELANFCKMAGRIGRWKLLQAALTKAYGEVRA